MDTISLLILEDALMITLVVRRRWSQQQRVRGQTVTSKIQLFQDDGHYVLNDMVMEKMSEGLSHQLSLDILKQTKSP